MRQTGSPSYQPDKTLHLVGATLFQTALHGPVFLPPVTDRPHLYNLLTENLPSGCYLHNSLSVSKLVPGKLSIISSSITPYIFQSLNNLLNTKFHPCWDHNSLILLSGCTLIEWSPWNKLWRDPWPVQSFFQNKTLSPLPTLTFVSTSRAG